jgi:NAD(P)H dehydrogenase (quinone)
MISSSSSPTSAKGAGRSKIIISGATGRMGLLTVRELLGRGVPAEDLILVSRSPDKLAEYAAQGASVRFGDVDRPESLPAAYAGGDKMLFIGISAGGASGGTEGTIEQLKGFYQASGANPPRAPRHKKGLDAAVAAGVKHIVYTSMLNADYSEVPWAEDQRHNEANLKASGAAWTALRNATYAEYGVGKYAALMAEAGRVVVSPKETRVAFVTIEDCAAAAAGALTTPGHENKAYEITGPNLVNRRDVAVLLSAVTGKNIDVIEKADEPIPYEFVDYWGGRPRTVSTAVQLLSGRPATSMRDFLEKYKDHLDQMPQNY